VNFQTLTEEILKSQQVDLDRRRLKQWSDSLLWKLEDLNLRDKTRIPSHLRQEIIDFLDQCGLSVNKGPRTIVKGLNCIYQVQVIVFGMDDEEMKDGRYEK
jgi:hypothetical protein